jgi:hypothetical protein
LQTIIWVTAADAENSPERILAGACLTPVQKPFSQFAALDSGMRRGPLIDLLL